MISLERLRYFLGYDRATGIFTWKNMPVPHGKAGYGKTAGTLGSKGYVEIKIEGIRYKAHHLAWFYVTGEWPVSDLDHKDTIKSHNAFDNLRPTTVTSNQHNVGIRSLNTSGFKGVSWDKSSGKWRAQIRDNGRNMRLGTFSTKEAAAEAYARRATELHGEFLRLT